MYSLINQSICMPKYRVYNHVLMDHLGLDDVSFYCNVCQFG